MNRKFLLNASFFILKVSGLFSITSHLYGQVVTTQPAFPSSENEITLIFDLKLAQDGRSKGLLGKTTDVYLWSGAGTTTTGNAFEYTPKGQTDFSLPFEPGKMTSLGNDRWSIKLRPRTYFGVPASSPIKKLGLLLKSGDGKAQTEDIILPIYENEVLRVQFIKPSETSFFTEAGKPIEIVAVASKTSQLTLTLDSTPLKSAVDDTLKFTLVPAGSGSRQTVLVKATEGSEVAADTFTFTIAPQPELAALPSGMKDGVNYLSETSVLVSLYAPAKKFVYLIGEMTQWQPLPTHLMKRTPDGNRHWIQINGLNPGQEYAYQFLIEGTLAVGDPYAEKILDPNNDRFISATTYPALKPYPAGAIGIVSVLQTAQVPYVWKNRNFERPKAERLVVYELLVRDFVETRRYQTVADSLPYLKKLGINAIELMPVMEFSGNDSWGYNPIYYFAPDKAYGTKNALKEFIDRCHAQGIAVILDLVLNQADYEFPYVKMYWNATQPSADSPFFNPQATHPFSVFFDFNHESQATRDYVDRVAEFWLKEYRVDGYRFDLSKGFTQKNTGSNVAAWGSYDESRINIWKRIYDKIRSYDPTAYVILEHFSDAQEERELAAYGMLLWGNANFDYRKAAAGEARSLGGLSYKERMMQTPSLMGYMESHDEERLLYDLKQTGGSRGTYSIRDEKTALDRAKLAAAFFLPIPGPKLIWQFGEYGYDISIDQGGRTSAKPVLWTYLQRPEQQRLLGVYQALLALRASYPAFHSSDYTLDVGGMVKRITLNDPAGKVFILGNFDVQTVAVSAGFPAAGTWYDYFTGAPSALADPALMVTLQPGEFHIFTSTPVPAPAPGLVPWGGQLSSVTSVPQVTSEVVVYPNPGNRDIQVQWNSPYHGQLQLELTDMAGHRIFERTVEKNTENWTEEVSLDRIVEGLYLLKIQTPIGTFVRKVVVE